ncbi:MAG: GNAT family N-acetyltransferase [Oscillospiraceae bacterium]|nr:GNAT family N-acetyltransferase [Oscillospiraceae bacterium]
MRYAYQILVPGGNDTALVFGREDDPARRKAINDEIMQACPQVEQVGFLDLAASRLCMAGGEFCGNAARAAAWYICGGRPGEVRLTVSGVQAPLRAGVTTNGHAFAQMPVEPDLRQVRVLAPGFLLATLEGIAHVVVAPAQAAPFLLQDREALKRAAHKILRQYGLLAKPAAGVVFLESKQGMLHMHPCVRVAAIDTMFYETACGSGAMAVALAKCATEGFRDTALELHQPSGQVIAAHVQCGEDFCAADACILGPVQTDGVRFWGDFRLLRVQGAAQLQAYWATESENVFAGYQASFGPGSRYDDATVTPLWLKQRLQQYLAQGVLLFCVDAQGRVAGLAASVPLASQEDVAALMAQFGFGAADDWYHADICVYPGYRGQGIATALLQMLTWHTPARRILMRTRSDNIESQRLHTRFGFREVPGLRQRFGADDERIFLSYEKLSGPK